MLKNIKNLQLRAAVIDAIRQFFKHEGFLEVETPLLVPSPSTEPYLEVFSTKLRTDDGRQRQAFLTTSPEYAMKKMLAKGVGSCFQICKSFRNEEGIGSTHNHEFTILEWYRTPGDYQDIMVDLQNLVRSISLAIGRDPQNFVYQGQSIDLQRPWIRLSIAQAFKQYAGVSKNQVGDAKVLQQVVNRHQLSSSRLLSYDDLFQLIMLNLVEPNLSKSQPTIIYDYPISQASLSLTKVNEPDWAERFEAYIAGLEIGNAFSELGDPVEQLTRMQDDLASRKEQHKTSFGIDQGLISALESGLPKTGGIAVGVDRLAMLMADSDDIKDVIAFPDSEMFNLD